MHGASILGASVYGGADAGKGGSPLEARAPLCGQARYHPTPLLREAVFCTAVGVPRGGTLKGSMCGTDGGKCGTESVSRRVDLALAYKLLQRYDHVRVHVTVGCTCERVTGGGGAGGGAAEGGAEAAEERARGRGGGGRGGGGG
eukprot:100558-Rhodomonas_salina.2